MEIDLQYGLGPAPWKRIFTMDMGMHNSHGHIPLAWTCTMDKDIQQDMDMHHGHGLA